MANLNWKDAMYVKLDKELRNGTYVLSSDLLKKERAASRLYDSGLLPMLFFLKVNFLIIVPIMAWLLIVNDGWIISLLLAIAYVLVLFLLPVGGKSGVLVKISTNFFHSLEPYNNTMKSSGYLIKKLRKAEKAGGKKGLEMYSQLVKEMDEKYGRNQHLLAPPYNQTEETKKKFEEHKKKMEQLRKWIRSV